MLVKTFGSAVYGIEAITITVEVNIAAGTKYFIVGLPDIAVKESYFRIESALKNTFYFDKSTNKLATPFDVSFDYFRITNTGLK